MDTGSSSTRESSKTEEISTTGRGSEDSSRCVHSSTDVQLYNFVGDDRVDDGVTRLSQNIKIDARISFDVVVSH